MYKVARLEPANATMIVRDDGAWIPVDPANKDYQEYLAWLAEGNEPEEWAGE